MTALESVLLTQAQHAYRGQAEYVPVTVLFDRRHAAATVAQALELDAGSVYCYYTAWLATCGLSSRITWCLLTSAQLAGLGRDKPL